MNLDHIEDIYPISPTQHGMLFHSLYSSGTGVYFTQFCCAIDDELDVPSLKRAWEKVIQRHSILRTSFVWEGLEEPVQVVRRQVSLPWEELDWRGLSHDDQLLQLEEHLRAERRQRSDPSVPPLMRLTLLRMADNAYQFVWSCHHILIDGWSMPLLMKEVFALYEAYAQGEELELPRPRPYRNYIAWLQQQDMTRAESYWRERLRGFRTPSSLGMLKPPATNGNGATATEASYEERRLSMTESATSALQTLARQQQLTLNTVVQGAWAVLLSRYSGASDVVFGVTVSGRPAELEGMEEMMGLFINTLPVRMEVRGEEGWPKWLKRMQAEQVEMRQYEYSPLVQVQGWSEVPRGLSLFESIFVFENYPIDKSLLEPSKGTGVGAVRSIRAPHYPMTITAWPNRELTLRVSYDSTRFSSALVTQMFDSLIKLLTALSKGFDVKLETILNLLDEWEREERQSEEKALEAVRFQKMKSMRRRTNVIAAHADESLRELKAV